MRPDFDELVGSDLEPSERARLERVHELLVAAGPPPDPLDAAPSALVDGSPGRSLDFTETMVGTAAAGDATASLAIYGLDDAGNWPMELTVAGLPPAPSGRPFELWLTRGGELAALCGSFLTSSDGVASVPLNAPYRFDEFDGWVIVEEGSQTPLLST